VAQLPVAIGAVVAGKYRVERVLGEGGMGVVAAARHMALGEPVALKFLHAAAAADADLVARFEREARTSASIRSEHVVRVTDVGELDSGAPFMVMEYLEGEDLGAIVERGPPLGLARAIDMVLQACEAIAEAHALGIVHRDLKPSNLFVTQRLDGTPFVKVLDFGISKTAKTAPGEAKLTRTNAILGSPCYMSPEQMLDSRNVDARSDIWAVGVVLYEILARRPPFDGESIPEVSAKIAASPHTPIQSVRPDIPDALAAVIDRTLAKRPADRYPSVADLAHALAPFAPPDSSPSVRRIEAVSGRSEPRLPRSDPSIAHEKTVAAPPTSAPARTIDSGRRIRIALAGVLGALVLVAATGAAWSLSRRAPPEPKPSPAPSASISVVADRGVFERDTRDEGDRDPPSAAASSAPTKPAARTTSRTAPPPIATSAAPTPSATPLPFDSRK
jgi:serine/threonine-protein kinase